MKILPVLALICLCLSTSVLAQKHRWGISAGPTLSSLHNEKKVGDYEPQIRFNLHAIYDLQFHEKFGFQTELGYTLAGDEWQNLHYLTVPVTFNYKALPWLRPGIGPQFGLLLNPNPWVSTFDAGIHLGAEIMVSDKFSIGVRNYFGMVYRKFYPSRHYRYIDDHDPLIVDENESFKINRNNIFQLNVRYYFPTRLRFN
jgi:outer membrane immunogenic protein